MSSKRKVAFYAPDGTEVTYETSGKWDTAGIVEHPGGSWSLVANGFSPDAVRKRTVAYYRSHRLMGFAVTPIWEATAPVVREYFGSHRVRIGCVWIPGQGWVKKNCQAGRSVIRSLAKQGVTAIEFVGKRARTGFEFEHAVDFQMSELFKSMRTPMPKVQVPACSTVGHSDHPATHEISYNYRGEDERTTETVCLSCSKHYENRPVLVNLTVKILGA